MIIKVCGMRDADNIRQLDEAKIADWIGFIFYEKSKRNVSSLPAYMPQKSKRVGVFVNFPMDEIIEKVMEFGLNIVQLHGNETPEFCNELRNQLSLDIKIIKMIQIESCKDLQSCAEYEPSVDYFLFETKCNSYGGSGQQFDWEFLKSYSDITPFILTGGIGPEDVEKINSFDHPLFAGIDLNSKFEICPAFKDIELLKTFVKQLKS